MADLMPMISSVSALLGVAITMYGQSVVAKSSRQFDLEKERLKLAHESAEKRRWLVRERLERLHLLVGEIGREFSLTFLTIDRQANLTRPEYHQKYRLFCSKVEEAQMIADLYMQSISAHLLQLDGEMNGYWGNFDQMLYLEEQGQQVDHTTTCYQEAFTYSRSIPQKVASIQREIRSRSVTIMREG